MKNRTLQPTGPRYWRSLDELAESPAARNAAEHEFPPGTFEPATMGKNPLARRHFLGLLGAATAMATVACSRRERGPVVPYTKRPEEIIPGNATYYASTFSEGHRTYSVLVKTREGRPILVMGNPEHPRQKGKTSPRAMADLLSLYDPDRLRAPHYKGRNIGWSEAEATLVQAFRDASKSNKRVLLLAGAHASPTRKALIQDLQSAYPQVDHVTWEPLSDATALEASRMLFGTSFRMRPRIENTQVILSLGSDFLNGDDPETLRTFAARRKPGKGEHGMNRLWAFEGPMSLTGSNADHRFPVKPSRLAALAFALAKDLNRLHGLPLPKGLEASTLPNAAPSDFQIPAHAWAALLKDLSTSRGKALVLCGDTMPLEAHVAAHLLNATLGAASSCMEYLPAEKTASPKDMNDIVPAMAGGNYGAVLLWGTNPAYTYPDAEAWKSAIAKVPQTFWVGQIPDESAAQCQWLLPEHHWLEAWGDHVSATDLISLQQPCIGALFESKQGEELLLALLKAAGKPAVSDYHTYLKERWQNNVAPKGLTVPFERYFQAALHDGFVRTEAKAPKAPELKVDKLREAIRQLPNPSTNLDFELLLSPSPACFDGRYANNAWLQEWPDPVTKSTWGNPVSLAPTDATKLSCKDGDILRFTMGKTQLESPVLIQPGQAPGLICMALGHGRSTGRIAKGVGINAYPLVDPSAPCPNLSMGGRLQATGRHADLPITQGHHRMEGRDLVRSFTLKELAKESLKSEHKETLTSLYPDQQFPEHKWGMVIDLSACIGCSACVLACQAENNVAVVGPEQVAKGREMHWIRVDRYYEGDPANPAVVHQPMLCQHCDHAPCENVCPVNATTHSPDGLNQMTYNRCVGTRYCANNCPYKVRRFNFFEYMAHRKEPETLVNNPEVTVRPRGVMEKCSFCVQRIQDARIRAKAEKRPLKDGEIQTACADACPAKAIVFGDLKDPNSLVSKLAQSPRRYKVLEELGVRPAITYLAQVKNPAEEGSHES